MALSLSQEDIDFIKNTVNAYEPYPLEVFDKLGLDDVTPIDNKRYASIIGYRTAYHDESDRASVKGDVFPDMNGTLARDRMSVRAVLAHEYYGHREHRGTKLPKGNWQDEVRASMSAAVRGKGLTDEDRQSLMQDAIDRMKEAGVKYRITPTMRRILYGY